MKHIYKYSLLFFTNSTSAMFIHVCFELCFRVIVASTVLVRYTDTVPSVYGTSTSTVLVANKPVLQYRYLYIPYICTVTSGSLRWDTALSVPVPPVQIRYIPVPYLYLYRTSTVPV